MRSQAVIYFWPTHKAYDFISNGEDDTTDLRRAAGLTAIHECKALRKRAFQFGRLYDESWLSVTIIGSVHE